MKMNDENRKIRSDGKELGIFSIDQLYRMAMRGDINHTSEFWCERQSAWLPLAGIIIDMYPSRLDQMRDTGFKKVKILGSNSDDCPACLDLQKNAYPIDEAPTLPPKDCTCIPWCRLEFTVDESCF
jgi:hypothetical protein